MHCKYLAIHIVVGLHNFFVMKSQQDSTNASSPYMQLPNLCYELRHEISLLEESIRKKDALISTYETEVAQLKRKLVEVEGINAEESESNLVVRIDTENDRLRLMAEVARLESSLRSAECTIRQRSEEMRSVTEQNVLLREELMNHIKLDSVFEE